MQSEWQKKYDKVRTITPSKQIRIRTTPSPERPIKMKFAQSPVQALYTASTKATAILPLQNEHKYTMPETRQGCRAIELSNQLGIVIGGHSHRESLEFNFMDLQNGQWMQKQQFQEWEYLKQRMKENDTRLGSHFSLNYDAEEQTIYCFGGERIQGVRRQINILSQIKNHQIQQFAICGIGARRNHTSTLMDNQLIIIGGFEIMNTKPNYYGDIQSINLSTMRSTQLLKQFMKNGLAYHQVIRVYKKNQYFEEKENGIYLFGGKDQEDNFNGDLIQIVIGNQVQVNVVQTVGQQPKARRNFTMNYDENSQCIIIFGGMNDFEIFEDLYTLNIQSKIWCNVQLSGYLNLKARYDHCSLYSNEKLIIFGGLNEFGYILFNPILINLKLKRQKLNHQE
ncbi:unnamed protein product [Paramecium sonneborni]|uniref:Kelch motif family protein n=1 Tax=Paramecium sonneborni TaxID=65129 RepID=A0A8S1RAH8_9CILI|nr:unnamed protein product [Paramecium sonneborni]